MTTNEPPPPPAPPPPPPPPPVPSQPTPPPGVPSPLADWATRALGFLVDWAPVFIVSLLTYRVSFFFNILSIAYIAYLGHLDGVSGQTPGKAIMGTRVVNLQGQLIGSGAGIGRKFAHILDSLICGLGYLLPLVDAKRQTIADKVMTTFVVTGLEKKSFSLDLWKPPPTTTT